MRPKTIAFALLKLHVIRADALVVVPVLPTVCLLEQNGDFSAGIIVGFLGLLLDRSVGTLAFGFLFSNFCRLEIIDDPCFGWFGERARLGQLGLRLPKWARCDSWLDYTTGEEEKCRESSPALQCGYEWINNGSVPAGTIECSLLACRFRLEICLFTSSGTRCKMRFYLSSLTGRLRILEPYPVLKCETIFIR
jgi:hypothetical protein